MFSAPDPRPVAVCGQALRRSVDKFPTCSHAGYVPTRRAPNVPTESFGSAGLSPRPRAPRARTLIAVPLIAGLASLGFGLYGIRAQRPQAPTDGPDVVLFTLCSIRTDHVHAYGYEGDTTPNIDRLAAAGTRYVNAYAAGAYTGSSHAALFTGLLPSVNGIVNFGNTLAPSIPTLPEVLGLYGYSTAVFMRASGPMTFGTADGLARGFGTFQTEFADTPQLASQAAAWWSAAPHPRFLVVHLRDAHSPYARADDTTDPRIRTWQTEAFRPGTSGARATAVLGSALPGDPALRAQLDALYDHGVHTADAGVGTVLAALKPDRARTMVIVTGDHGEALGEDGHLGHQRYDDEAVVHVPLVIDYPRAYVPDEPALVRTEVSLVDLLPTLPD